MKASLKGSTVLVTGGAGLIGSHIIDRLIDEGAGEIRVLDNLVRGRHANLAAAKARKDLKFIDGDVRDRETVSRAVAGRLGARLPYGTFIVNITACLAIEELARVDPSTAVTISVNNSVCSRASRSSR